MSSKARLASMALLWALGCGLLWRELREQRRALDELRQQVGSGPPSEGGRCPIVMAAPGQGISSEMVDAVARQVARRLGDARPGASPAAQAAEPVPPTVEQAQAIDAYRHVVDSVLARGRVSKEDSAQLQRQMALAGHSPEVDELRSEIIVAINTNRLTIDDPRSFVP